MLSVQSLAPLGCMSATMVLFRLMHVTSYSVPLCRAYKESRIRRKSGQQLRMCLRVLLSCDVRIVTGMTPISAPSLLSRGWLRAPCS